MLTPYSRLNHMLALWKEGVWGKWVGAAWAAYGVFLGLRDGELIPADPSGGAELIPTIPLAWWIVGAAGAFFSWCFEASFRLQRKSVAQLNELESKLAAPARITREQLATLYAADRLRLIDELHRITATVFTNSATRSRPANSNELKALASRFNGDGKFSERWLKLTKALLDCHQNAVSDDNREAITAFDKKYGLPLLEARDDVIAYLREVP